MADRTAKILLGIIAASLIVIAVNVTTTATASRQITDVNIVKVSDRFIGPTVPVSIQKQSVDYFYLDTHHQIPLQGINGVSK